MNVRNRWPARLATVLLSAGTLAVVTPGAADALPPPPACPPECDDAPDPGPHPPEAHASVQYPDRLRHLNGSVIEEDMNTWLPPGPRTGVMELDGCSSSGGADRGIRRPRPIPLTTYRWTFSDGRPEIVTDTCRASTGRVLSSEWQTLGITLTVTNRDGQQASTTLTARYRNLVIASLGDSAAGGEGAPDVPGRTPNWSDYRCDRSGRAASAQSALRLQLESPGTTVTFIHLACSGAAIGDEEGANGGMLAPQAGVHPIPGRMIAPQVDRLRDMVQAAGRPVDALLITIGANDLKWADALADCYDWLTKNCIKDWDRKLRDRMRLLQDRPGAPSMYSRLADRLRQLTFVDPDGRTRPMVTPDRVLLTEYYDPTHDPLGYSLICPQDPFAPSPHVRKWGYEVVERPLNRAVRDAATTHGWRFVGGIAEAFYHHGVCSALNHTWVLGVPQSMVREGDEYGAWHPNETGQRVIADKLLETLRPVVGMG